MKPKNQRAGEIRCRRGSALVAGHDRQRLFEVRLQQEKTPLVSAMVRM
jgi:hypothetical protein